MKSPFGDARYANVTSTLALVVALGGTSYAAVTLPRNSVGSAQLKPKAVRNADLGTSAVTSKNVRDGGLLMKDFRAGQIPRGATGPQGPKGDTGTPGAPGAPGVTAPAVIADNSIGAAKITDGGLGAHDIGRFAGVLTGMPFGTLNPGACASPSSTSLTPIVAGQDLQNDVIIVTPPPSLALTDLTITAKAASANTIEVTICNRSTGLKNLGALNLRFVTIDVP